MSVLPVGMGSSGVDVGDIGHSLRLRASASAYLSRTQGSGSSTKCTISLWCKRSELGVYQYIINAGDLGANEDVIRFNVDGTLQVLFAGAANGNLTSTRVFRDPTAHLHFVVTIDTTSAAADRVKVSVNGEAVTMTGTNQTGAALTGFNVVSLPFWIGKHTNGTAYHFDGYISRIAFIDGQALAPSSFGYQNTEINEWVSKSQSQVLAVVEAGGTNSFMLDFDDATSLTTLGYDKSTKNNDWTLNNVSLTSGVTYDHMLDVPGNSYATLNPIIPSAANISYANLRSGTTVVQATQDAGVLPSGAYWEVTAGASAVTAGVISAAGTTNTTTVTANKVFGFRLTSGDALDYINITDAGAWTSITTGLTGERYPYGVTQAADWNFGQRPFIGTASGQSICQANLPLPAILDPTDHFHVATVTKSGNTNFTVPWDASVYDTFFEIKRRDAAGDWYQIDGLRGYDKILKSNSTAAETTDANVLGISGTTGTLKSTLSDGTYIVSATKAGLTASRQTNTDGTITSTVSRNVDSGFAIVLVASGTGAAATIGHGLGAVAKMIRGKNLDSVTSHVVYHVGLTSAAWTLYGETTSAQDNNTTVWNSVAPTSAVFSVGTSVGSNQSTKRHIFYCYADSAIQKSFSYTGNGNADGPYVNLGMKIGRALLKNASAAYNWNMFDSAREPENVMDYPMAVNTADAEGVSTLNILDATSLGLKIRNTGAAINGSTNTIIGHAWAATNGKYSLAR